MYGIYTDSLLLSATPHDEPVKIDMIAIVDEDFSRMTPGQLREAPAIEFETKTLDFGEIDRNGGLSPVRSPLKIPESQQCL